MCLITAASAQLDPKNSLYCNMNPGDFPIPVIQPEGLELQQLQVSCGGSSVSLQPRIYGSTSIFRRHGLKVFIRHGDRTRASAIGACWPEDDTE